MTEAEWLRLWLVDLFGAAQPWANILGVMGALLGLASYVANSHIRLCLTASVALWLLGLQFALLGAMPACALCWLSTVRLVCGPVFTGRSVTIRWVGTCLFASASIALTIPNWAGWSTGLPLAVGLLLSWANFHTEGRRYRQTLLLVEAMMFLTSLLAGAWASIALACAGFTLNLVYLTRTRLPRVPVTLAPA